MHQHPTQRAAPPSASPALSERTNPTRTNNPRSDRAQESGSSDDFTNTNPRQEQQPADTAGPNQRLNQIVQNLFAKAALVVLHSRVELSPAYNKSSDTKRENKWFGLILPESEDSAYRNGIKKFKAIDVAIKPPPLHIEVFLTADNLPVGQRLCLDEDSRRYDVASALEASADDRHGKRRDTEHQEILLERWFIELGDQTAPLPADLAPVLPLVYKKSIVLFRALFTYCNFLPAWKLSRRLGKSRSTIGMKIGYRLIDGPTASNLTRSDNLGFPLTDSPADVTTDYSFGVTETPVGPFGVRVTYRQNCDFRIDDSEELLSSRFLGADDDIFRPSMPSDRDKHREASRTEIGSLPTGRRAGLFERPELGHAYGSLSTYHQAGIAPSTSPLSALRDAKDYSTASPPTPEPVRPGPSPQAQPSTSATRNSLRAQAAGRRSSFSFQPFKQPTLSASPLGVSPLGSSPRLTSGHVPTLGSLTEEAARPPPNAPAVAARKPASMSSEHTAAQSTSSSPKPAPVTRYSSSFSHRRARLSSGGTTVKTEDDQNSSGRGSAASSVQPGSGLLTEVTAAGGSSGSMQDDDESIQEFLKLLDIKKDTAGPEDAAATDSSTRRTAAALNRFHRMRDSNAALSDSLSSSLMLHRSSSTSSRQLSSVPAMVAATSASTSSSPGKPISPHTPHTPFAPSRLSAAYSHDDDAHHVNMESELPHSPSETNTSDTVQGRSSANVPAIDIPNSPRPFLNNEFRRSSSAQRRPRSEDTTDAYGLRSASMGTQERRANARSEHPLRAITAQEPDPVEITSLRPAMAAVAGPVDGASDSGSGRSSALAQRARLARGSGRGQTPPHGSSSSFGAAGSADKSGADSGSASGSWRGIGRRVGSRPDNTLHMDEDEMELPFAMEKSDFQSPKEG
jgi:autophagy-related protein 13